MYCTRDIPSVPYQVFMSRRSENPTHTVTIRRVSTINSDAVRSLTRRRSSNDPSAMDMNAKSLGLLQLIVRQAPNMRHGFPADARSFYVDSKAKDLRIGLSAWRGFFQSVRPTLGRLIINIDVSHALVYTGGPLVTTMMQYLNLRDSRGLQTLSPSDFRKLRTFLKGVVVSITVSPKMRARPISDLVLAAGQQVFDKDNESWTVQRHFETKYGKQVRYPKYVGVKVGRTAIIPAEFCIVRSGQVFRKKIPPDVQRGFLEFATQKPDHRFGAIKSAVTGGIFNYADSDYMREAGMAVSDEPMELSGEVITPPPLMYGGSQQLQPTGGSWNMVGRRFYKPGVMRSWMVVNYSSAQEQVVRQFIDKIEMSLQRLGLRFPARPLIYGGQPSDPKKVLEDRGSQVRPELVICVLPHDAAEIRQAIKNWGDCKRSISTQCVRGGKWERGNDQYCNNVALKINARLGGVNSVIDDPGFSKFLGEAMIVGADVGHPGPGVTNRPSITGLVASLDPQASVMTCCSFVQQPRQEMIEDLEEMLFRFLGDWRSYRREKLGPQWDRPPKTVVFYRDGVSEGEFDRVAQYEVPKIKSAFAKAQIPPNLWPKIIFIVVAKRHHVRFFAKHSDDRDRSGNCPAGLLVADSIINPNYENFYLQSHAGLLGTSRPTHYIVLANEASLGIKNIQQLTFKLCHMYVSATRSVSIPAPVYYADRMCTRLPFFCANGASLSDTASERTSSTAPNVFDLEQWRRTAGFQTPVGLRHRMPFA
ncbi:Piwi-domain-containing protein [Dichomitus squalens]|uniref:Piwi-domain-containing protein n=1 Tax=Dichomitus squalens TaxID=114155 RepID=A0A4Q9MWI6_9APHY|nr:Piwi-domain-containing protein [Dichomitus squalens]